MGKSVVEEHKQVYHYTTAAGLQGIVETQQLRATNISYLNDAEEHTGFFDRRLPDLLEEPIRAVVTKIGSTRSHRSRIIAEAGGIGKAVEKLKKEWVAAIRFTTLTFDNPYVTSFCSASNQGPLDDGLLSQWRGYGLDGGYAIVFETEGLDRLLKEDAESFCYQYLSWGDVEYYDQDDGQKTSHEETLEYEQIIKETVPKFIMKKDRSELEPLVNAVTALSCLHKHRGFKEEAEVRIVALPPHANLHKELKESGDDRPRKPVQFVIKNGIPVPYIMLFRRQSDGNATKLPISKIIVGPHSEKLKRQKAVQLILEQYEIEATVSVSDIPYLGR